MKKACIGALVACCLLAALGGMAESKTILKLGLVNSDPGNYSSPGPAIDLVAAAIPQGNSTVFDTSKNNPLAVLISRQMGMEGTPWSPLERQDKVKANTIFDEDAGAYFPTLS